MRNSYIFGNVGEAKSQIGTNTMVDTSGEGNSAYGNNIFTSLTTGVHNSGFGSEIATSLSANPSYCSALGYKVLTNITTGIHNSAFGYQTLQALTTGSNNSTLGSNACLTLISGSGNTVCGDSADVITATTTEATVVGAGATGASKSLVLGRNAACFSTSSNSDCIVTGTNLQLQSGSSKSLLVSGYTNTATPTLINSTMIWTYLDANGTSTDSTVFLVNSNPLVLNYTDSVHIGRREMTGSRNVAITGGTFGPTSDNVVIGLDASAGTNENTLIGYEVSGAPSGARQVCSGHRAMSSWQDPTVPGILGYTLDIQSDFNALYSGGGFYTGFLFLKIVNQTVGNVTNSSGGTAAVPYGLVGVVTIVEGSVTEQETTIVDFTGLQQSAVLGTYFLISSTTTDYYVWFTNGFSTDPLVPGRTGVPILVPSFFGADSTAWVNTISALSALEGGTAFLVGTGIIRIENAAVGNAPDPGTGTAFGTNKLRGIAVVRQGNATFPEVTAIDYGNPSIAALNGTYFLLSSPTTNYYFWFTDGSATDPGPPGLNIPALIGKTGIQVYYIPVQNNTAIGDEAFRGNIYAGSYVAQLNNSTGFGSGAASNWVLGGCNTMFGYNIADSTQRGSNNTGIGASIFIQNDAANSVAIGKECGVSQATNATVIGSRTFTFNTSTNVSFIGENSVSGFSDNQFQIGNASLNSPTESLKFRTQTVADEVWVNGGETSVFINGSGDIIRNNDTVKTVSTTNSTFTVLDTFALSDNTSVQLETRLMGRMTGGRSGVTNNVYAIRIDSAAKRTGTITLTKTTETHVNEDTMSLVVTNLSASYSYNISKGNSTLYSVNTLVKSRSAYSKNLSYLDLNGYFYFYYSGFYFLTSSPSTDYYVWYNAGGETDPMISGRTGIQVAIGPFDNSATLASLTAAALNAVGAVFTASTPSTCLRISASTIGNLPDIVPGTASTGGVGEIEGIFTFAQGSTDPPTFDKSLIDFTGATPAGLAGKWFYIFDSTTSYYVWYRVDTLTPTPINSRLTGLMPLLVDILSTDTANVIATKTSSVLSLYAFTNSTTVSTANMIKWENVGSGACTPTTNGNMPSNIIFNAKSFTTGVAEVSTLNTTDTTPAGLNGKYFFLASPTTDYYFWYNVDGATTDPAPAGPHTSAPIAILSTDTSSMIFTKTSAAINALGGGTVFSAVTQPPWSADLVINGTNLEVRVTGMEAIDISWKSQTRRTNV